MNSLALAIPNFEFLEEVFVEIPEDAAMIVTGFGGDPNKPPKGAWSAYPYVRGETLPRQISRNNNNYFCISAFYPEQFGAGRIYRRRKDSFARLGCVMLDDLGTKVPFGKVRLPLSARIVTSPGNCQGFYFVEPDSDSDNLVTATRLIDAMIRDGLAAAKDPGMSAVTRYARLPVGTNGKAALKEPFHVQMHDWNPTRRYTVRQIADAYQLDLTPPTVKPLRQVALKDQEFGLDNYQQLMQFIDGQGWYLGTIGEWHHIQCPWVHEHTDRAITGTAVRAPGPQNNWAGGFKCHHGHCEKRTIGDLYRIIADHKRGWQA